MKKLLLVLIAAALVLTACSHEPDDDTSLNGETPGGETPQILTVGTVYNRCV